MVIHGANDPRVPVQRGRADRRRRCRRAARAVEYLRYEDEGHGLVRLAEPPRRYPQVAAFLERYLLV